MDLRFHHYSSVLTEVETMALSSRDLMSVPFVSAIFLTMVAGSIARAQAPAQKPGADSSQRAATKSTTVNPDDIRSVNLLEGLRSGQLAVEAKGTGDGRMTVSVTNRTRKSLRVVLPPGLVASGSSGQFGGMGGFGGGGMGGMGGGGMGGFGGGGMGGLGGGMMGGMGGGMMGGMGGGMMGGMGGGMGGMGGGMMGGMGGGMMGGGTMPASMGMIMLGRLIMNLTGEKESWDFTSLMMGMMGGMGGGMMGGMGGGMMGGMGGMGGGMGGGFRSLPPTSLPFAIVKPNQSRHLPTRLVSLVGPDPDGKVPMPAKGERLDLSDVDHLTNDALARAALKRIAEDKAPPNVAQLALWNVVNGFEWSSIEQFSRSWANAHELSLARDFVARLPELRRQKYGEVEPGTLYWELTTRRGEKDELTAEVRKQFDRHSVLGLTARSGIPTGPKGPSLSMRLRFDDDLVLAQVSSSDGAAHSWISVGKFQVDLKNAKGEVRTAVEVVDLIAESLLSRLADVKLVEGPRVKGKSTYKIRIDNASPLILNSLALAGKDDREARPTALAGFSIPPHRSLTVAASADAVDRLGLKGGIKLLAADLSGL
jgi:hypothetical protein